MMTTIDEEQNYDSFRIDRRVAVLILLYPAKNLRDVCKYGENWFVQPALIL